jgi:hypothetical protein
LEPGWWSLYSYACLGSRSSFLFDTTDLDSYSGIVDSVLGVGMEFIYGLQLRRAELENPISPCYMEVATNEILATDKTFIYPNPSSGFISFKTDNIESFNYYTFSIRNILGIEVMKIEQINESSLPISVSGLHSGVYFVSLIGKQNNWIKTEKIFINN